MAKQHSDNVTGGVGLRRGQRFNPYRMFTGLFIPEGLARCTWISAGAKLAWGRLARYSGHKGWCFPSKKAVGEELGVGARQAQKYIAELERHELLRRISRFNDRGQTSNAYEFLWHELFEDGENIRSWGGENDRSGEGENDHSPKESQIEESHSEESQNIDLDYPPANRKNRNSRLDIGDAPSARKQYLRLREALADYNDAKASTSPPLDKLRVQAAGEISEIQKGVLKAFFRGYDQVLLQNVFQDLQAKLGSR